MDRELTNHERECACGRLCQARQTIGKNVCMLTRHECACSLLWQKIVNQWEERVLEKRGEIRGKKWLISVQTKNETQKVYVYRGRFWYWRMTGHVTWLDQWGNTFRNARNVERWVFYHAVKVRRKVWKKYIFLDWKFAIWWTLKIFSAKSANEFNFVFWKDATNTI